MNKPPKYLRFPERAIKEFLANPSEKTLSKIKYACFELEIKCHECPFDTTTVFCPPPSGRDHQTEGLAWYCGGNIPKDRRGPALAKLVLEFSEVLAAFENKKQKRRKKCSRKEK